MKRHGVLAHESACTAVLDRCAEPWRRAIYLPPEPLPALGQPTRRSRRRSRQFTVGSAAALLLTITIMGVAIVLGVAYVV